MQKRCSPNKVLDLLKVIDLVNYCRIAASCRAYCWRMGGIGWNA